MTDLSPADRELLSALVEEGPQSPGDLALALEADLGIVSDRVDALRDRGLIERQGFDSRRLTAGGRERFQNPSQ